MAISEYMGRLKGKSAIRVLCVFRDLRRHRFWGNQLWAQGYCVGTVGLDAEMIRKYVTKPRPLGGIIYFFFNFLAGLKAGIGLEVFLVADLMSAARPLLLDTKVSINMIMNAFRFFLCAAAVAVLPTLSARANVYATDIQVNGNLTNANASIGSPVSITYRLNQTADLGVTVNVLQGTSLVTALAGGTNMGLNSVSWTPSVSGTFSIDITAAASGFTNWEQISVDTNSGMAAFLPLGIAVDNNTNSPYYGRVILSCATHTGTASGVPGAAIKTGFFKMNADGSQADEGWYGNANYLSDDGGDAPVAGQMPDSWNAAYQAAFDPMKVRIGADDRIYWVDNSFYGAIIACDMQATTNQVVVCEGPGAGIGAGDVGPSWWGMEDVSCCDWAGGIGFQEFDVSGATTTNAAVWLCDNDYGNGPNNWGVWMFHMTNGAVDPNDVTGTQAVFAGSPSDLSLVSSGGCTVDANLDIFVGQSRNNENAVFDSMVFTNYNGGVLPPENSGQSLPAEFGLAAHEVQWGYGCGVDTTCATDPSFEAVADTVINSRTSPTIVACPMAEGSQFVLGTTGGGIRLLNATNGSILTVTNGSGTVIQKLTNLDNGQAYTCAAWDNAGNLYGASTTRHLWRVWSPPGTNTNTTMAVAQVIVPGPFEITSITAMPTSAGCANVTITFNAFGNLPPSAFTLLGSPTVNGTFTAVAGAVITGGSGVYHAAFSNCSTEFFEIEQP